MLCLYLQCPLGAQGEEGGGRGPYRRPDAGDLQLCSCWQALGSPGSPPEDLKGRASRQVSREWHSKEAVELPLPSQGKAGCSRWGEVDGQTKHAPLLGMRRQQGRDRGEMECWETRADRLPAARGERSPGVPTGSPNLPSTLLKSLGLPKPTQCSLPSPSFSPK